MTRSLATLALVVATALPLAAQGNMAGMPGMGRGNDPTNQVKGSGTLPAGWNVRFDPPRGSQPTPSLTAINFVTMGSGYHITSGPAALYYNNKDMESGVYGASATFKAAKSMAHESYGVFIGGHNLQDSTQTYLYMVIRPLDGGVAIGRRTSNGRPVYLLAMGPNDAVNKDGSDGSSTNTVLIHVAKDSVHFVVNGKMVKAMAKSELGAPTDGQAGMRVNHNIDIHVDSWAIQK